MRGGCQGVRAPRCTVVTRLVARAARVVAAWRGAAARARCRQCRWRESLARVAGRGPAGAGAVPVGVPQRVPSARPVSLG